MATLARILIFPIKSLDGVSVPEARVTAGGILEHDRVYAILDEFGAFVNGKRTARVNALRAEYSADFREVRLWENGGSPSIFALEEPEPINRWLSEFFGFRVSLGHEPKSGFPDDREASGPTVTSEASLEEISRWFLEKIVDKVRQRFRTNLEVSGVPAFWEDRLFGASGELQPFRIGEVALLGHNPCQRCVVPTRDSRTGEKTPDFQKIFMARRKESLPAWANIQRFNHFYRFALNTSICSDEAGKWLRVGDAVTV